MITGSGARRSVLHACCQGHLSGRVTQGINEPDDCHSYEQTEPQIWHGTQFGIHLARPSSAAYGKRRFLCLLAMDWVTARLT